MDQFDVLIGTWTTEATHPAVDEVVSGESSFEWLEGEQFLIHRSHQNHELFPDAISVIGPTESGDELVMEYFDSRGVRRTYKASVEDGVWRWWRDQPGFEQRFSATLAPDEFEGRSQVARSPGDWNDDLIVTYHRRSDSVSKPSA